VFQNFAYEIGAVFLVVALLIGSTFLRGFFSQEMVRTFKFAAGALILAGAGMWAYHEFLPDAPTVTETKTPEAIKPAPLSKKAAALREADRKAIARAIAEEAAKPDVPVHIKATGRTETVPR
jgi:hypothetical protein